MNENGSSLILENVVSQDGGNYTCTVNSRKGQHELTVINFPNYMINARVLYSMEAKCQPGDGDIVSLHLPIILGNMICGINIIICKVEVKSCHCLLKVIYLVAY